MYSINAMLSRVIQDGIKTGNIKRDIVELRKAWITIINKPVYKGNNLHLLSVIKGLDLRSCLLYKDCGVQGMKSNHDYLVSIYPNPSHIDKIKELDLRLIYVDKLLSLYITISPVDDMIYIVNPNISYLETFTQYTYKEFVKKLKTIYDKLFEVQHAKEAEARKRKRALENSKFSKLYD